ncbi:hypothetical protein JCM6882_004672 [Rhodosporidiobolus microsporus]
MADTVPQLDKTATRTGDEESDKASSNQPAVLHREVFYATRQPLLPVYAGAKIANPTPLAFMSFGVGLYLISIVSLQVGELKSLSIIVPVALGYCGVSLLVAGIFEFPSGNPYGASLYCTLSGVFVSFALLLSPWSGVATSYTNPLELSQASGQLIFAFWITLMCFMIAAHKSPALFCGLFLVNVMLALMAVSFYYPLNTTITKAYGGLGIVIAFGCWYCALATLMTPESSLFQFPILGDPGRRAGLA